MPAARAPERLSHAAAAARFTGALLHPSRPPEALPALFEITPDDVGDPHCAAVLRAALDAHAAGEEVGREAVYLRCSKVVAGGTLPDGFLNRLTDQAAQSGDWEPDRLRELARQTRETGPRALDLARTLAETLPDAVKIDPRAAFSPEALAAAARLEAGDPVAFGRLKAGFQRRVPMKEWAAALRSHADTAPRLRVTEPGEEARPVLFSERFPDAPVPALLEVPHGYLIRDGGEVCRVHHTEAGPRFELVTREPCAVVGRLRNVDDGAEALRLVYRRGSWQTVTPDRADLMDARKLVGLSRCGVEVTSGRAGALSEYLAASEATNLDRLLVTLNSDRFGWVGRNGFLAGGLHLNAGDRPEAGTDEEGERTPGRVHFRAAGPGEEQRARAFQTAGTLEDWREAVAVVRDHPRAALGLYAAFAPTLLAIVKGCPNFLIDWAYITSHGKTMLLRIAASVWGCPFDGPESFLLSWDATPVGLERMAALHCDLPFIVDDSKRAKKPEDQAGFIYAYSQGQGRSRGQRGDGTREHKQYRGICLSTGEQPLTSFTTDGGTRARVLSVWGPPWGPVSAETARMIHKLKADLSEHHGHAGPAFVRWLLDRKADWQALREKYRALHRAYLEAAGDNPIAARLAEPFALLDLAGILAHEALALPWKYADPIGALWEDLTREARQAEAAEEALRLAVGWAHARQADFYGRHRTDLAGGPLTPPTGWAGRWEAGSSWPWIAFGTDTLGPKVLRPAGFDLKTVLRAWEAAGWIDCRPGEGGTKPLNCQGGKARFVVVKRAAADLVTGEPEKEERSL